MKLSIYRQLSLIIALVGLLVGSASAQNYSFMVLGAKGDNSINGEALRVGATIQQDQTVKVSDGAYLGLAHNSGKTLEIKKAGTYKVSDLESKITQSNSGLVGKYASFIIEELTSDDSKNNRFNQVSKTGSVTRAISDQSAIKILMPNGATEYLPGEVTIKWVLAASEDANEIDSYTFTAKNIMGHVIMEKEVKEPMVVLDLSELSKRDAKLIRYEVKANDKVKSLGDYALKAPRSSDLETIKKEIADIPSEDTPLNHYLRAEFFAQKGMVANAINEYETAGDAFSDSYHEFLKALNLSPDAEGNSHQEEGE